MFDENTVVTCSQKGVIQVWDINSGTLKHRIGLGMHISLNDICFCEGGLRNVSRVVLSNDIQIETITPEGAASNVIRINTQLMSVISFCFNADGSLLASGHAQQAVALWNANAGENVWKRYRIPIESPAGLHFSHDNAMIVAKGGNYILVLDARNGETLVDLKTELDYSCPTLVRFNHDSSNFVSRCANSPTITIWDVATRSKKCLLNEQGPGIVTALCYSVDGLRLFGGVQLGRILVWDATTYTLLNTFELGTAVIMCISISSDGARLAFGDSSSRVFVCDSHSGAIVMEQVPADSAAIVCFVPTREYYLLK